MFAVNANFLYASMRTKERRSLDINICTKLRVPQASFALQSMKAAIMQPCEIQIKCLRGRKEYGNISHGTKAMNTKFSVMQAVLSTQLPKSPFHLLSSLLLVTLDTNAQGQRGRERREGGGWHRISWAVPSTSCNDVGIQEAGGKFLCISMTLRM